MREADLSPLAGNAGGLIMKYETKSLLVREPVGVVAALCAFNFPLSGIAQKTAPAIVAGCTVVVKAPGPRPAGAVRHGGPRRPRPGFPPGVINIVAATREGSEHLVGHPDVDMVTFTGSTEVGKQIAEVCGAQVKRCVLELGGKSAAIVLEDADLDTALPMRRRRERRHEPGRELHLHEPDPRPAVALRRVRRRAHRGVREPQGRRPARRRHVVGR